MSHTFETQFGGRTLTIETGRLARLAGGSVTVRYGDTMVLGTANRSDPRPGLDFFPLTVDFEERMYAAGKIPGGFIKREGRPQDADILSARIIDRSIRPLFPEGYKDDVQVVLTVLSTDQQNDPDVIGTVAASDGRDSRLMKPPGILPAAYIRSSKSTVSGKKSRPGRGSDRLAVPRTIVSPKRTVTEPPASSASRPVSMVSV